MANIIKRVWNQNRMVQIEDLKGMTFQAEQAGHTFQISGIDDNGNTVALTGTPAGVLLRPDNTDVALTCSVSGGVVSATLPANCYDVPGRFGLTIFITSGSSKTAIYAAVGTVTRTSSGTAAPGTTQSVVDLINAINAAINSIPASYSALLADIAPTYSNSALYSVGQYTWYDGDLKRCIVPITTAESYTAAHWTSAVLGQDVSDLKSAINFSLIGLNKGEISIGDAGGYYNVSTGEFVANTATLDATLKFPVVPGMNVEAQVTGEKYYLFWDNAGVFDSVGSGRLDTGEKTVPTNASYCAIDYLTAKGTPITVKVSYQITASVQKNTEDIVELDNRMDAIEAGGRYAKAVDWWWYITSGVKVYDTSSFTGTEKIIVSGYNAIKANDLSGEKYYVFFDETDTYINFTRKDTGFADIPSNAKYCGFDFQTSQGATGVFFQLKKNESTGDVVCVRSGNDIQIKTKLHNTNKYIGLNASLVNRENEGFNMLKYVITDIEPKTDETITGTNYKYADDDICPIHYNGSYMGGNHGKEPVYKITSASHGKTTDDIGSVWTDANSKDYIIYKIDDENNISIMGDRVASSYAEIVISTPATPLVHKAGATHTGDIVFTVLSSQQLRPITNNKSVKVRNDKLEELASNGYITGRYIEIIESYRILDVGAIVEYLKDHVGSCDNNSYHLDSIADAVLVQNVYRFSKGGGCSVCIGITPLKALDIDYFGGVQSGSIGSDFFVPYTSYDTITTQQDDTRIDLDSSKWSDSDFPPYKYYQLNGDNGFAVGYCIDTAQADPSSRKLICSENAGFYYTSKKVYPMFYYKSSHPSVSSGTFCLYAFRAPFIKNGNKIELWYETADATYMEIELFNSWSGIINLPNHVIGKTIEVVKKTDSITIPSNIINTGGCYVKCTGTGSITLKFK